jgi:endoglucanase
MARSYKVRSLGILLLAVVFLSAIWFGPFNFLLRSKSTTSAHAAASLPFNQFANGPYTVQGSSILGNDGKPYLFHGVGRDGLEFICTGPGYLDTPHLALMGPPISNGVTGGTYWYGNTVRLPLSEDFWLHGFAAQKCTSAQYQGLVKSTVDALTSLKLNIILDLQWTDAGGQYTGGGASFQIADNDSVLFWTQVAKIYSGYSNVLFELLNEPHPHANSVPNQNTWACWQNGCQITNDTSIQGTCNCVPSYPGVGLQTLVNTVRGAGATNLVLVGGMNWGYDFSQLSSFPITGSNVVYDTHPYPYTGKLPQDWDAAFGYLTATAPVMSAESGQYDCNSDYMSQLLAYFDAHNMGWTAWSWYDVGIAKSICGYPQLISDYNGTPAANMGTYIHQHLLSYTNGTPPSPTPNPSPTPTPTPVTGPVSKQWYFAEGRTGGGFTEWLTLGNPTANACTVNIQYLYTPDRGSALTKTVSVSVPANQRVTEYVDGDLGTSPGGPGITDSAIVTVNNSATPSCTGIVAERPMYFNTSGNSLGADSGHDVFGTTSLSTNFYFADVAIGKQPGGGSYSSFISILNPPGVATAAVTATYYANGQQVGSQQINVPGGTRGTIFPGNANPALPGHVSAVVTSNLPVVVERPTYFSHINAGNAGTVSGAADVVGVQHLSNDWLFAEGYTGGMFQENFVIANLDPSKATASVTINLEYIDGTRHSFQLNVNALSQVNWNVNTNASNPTSQSVSAEITSTGANIVIEREMFFKYGHTANGRALGAMGGTDVIGQVGPAAATSYSFAEGYCNVGYDEWLTIQNPSGNTEIINVSLVNALGRAYTFPVTMVAHSRSTVDIVATVLQHMYQSGDSFKAFEVSMALQSSSGPFVAERPIYWNASSTQGGTDVVGFIG